MIQRTIHLPDADAAYLVEYPDGFYMVDSDSDVKLGPFQTAALARAITSQSTQAMNRAVVRKTRSRASRIDSFPSRRH